MTTPSLDAQARIRILTVCPQLTTGGAERQLLMLARHLDRSRFDLRIVYYEDAGHLLNELADLGVPVTHLDRARLGGVGLVRALRHDILTHGPDVLDCRLPSAYRLGRLAAFGAGVPVVMAQERTTHRSGTWRRLFDRFCNLWTDAWVGNSRAVADHLVRDLGVPADRVHVIYNGVDVEVFRSASPHPDLQRLRDQGRRLVLNLGRLDRPKNQRLFLATADRLRRRFGDLEFALCGEGPLRAALQACAGQLGLGDRCHFLGFQQDVASVLAAGDLLIQTSDWEGLPNAVMEAMAAGVPVVGTDAGGTRELIDDGVEGWVVPVGDADALEARASQVLADAGLARRLSQAAERKVRDRFSVRAMAQAYAGLVDRLLAGKRRPAERPSAPAGHSRAEGGP